MQNPESKPEASGGGEVEENPTSISNAIVHELKHLGSQLAFQNAHNCVSKFRGDKGTVKAWLSEIERESKLTDDTDERRIKLAYQSAEDIAGSFIKRYLESNGGGLHTWEELKTKLLSAFGATADANHALALLKSTKQKRQESIQIYGERLIMLAEDAFPKQDLDEPLISRQLIDCFIDGLKDSSIAKKLIRENPSKFTVALETASKEQIIINRIERRGRVETDMEIDKVTFDKKAETSDKKFETFDKRFERRPETRTCYHCHRQGHIQRDCRWKQTNHDIQCYSCGKRGHFARNCRSKNY